MFSVALCSMRELSMRSLSAALHRGFRESERLFFFVAVFANGFFVLLLEVIGARLIGPFYGSTIFITDLLPDIV